LVWFTPAVAEHRPKWEVGAGIGYLSIPDYRGSDEHTEYTFPYPYVVYRGERLRVGDGRVRGLLFDSETTTLDISINGAVPVNSSENEARQGMPDLDPSLEIGPSLIVSLQKDELQRDVVKLNLPLRLALAANSFDFKGIGLIFNPHLDYVHRSRPFDRFWRTTYSFGPVFATEDYHDFYYGVEPEFATTNRPVYSGTSGYSGSRLLLSTIFHLRDNLFIGGFVRYDTLAGASFGDSPLVRQNHALMGGIAITWSAIQSDEKAKHLE
jgi:outer membrane scaffolding protein for murein synthesis (MipA/OmpV family)